MDYKMKNKPKGTYDNFKEEIRNYSHLNEKMIKYEADVASIFHSLLHGAYPPGCSEPKQTLK